jgi:host factor-I protein
MAQAAELRSSTPPNIQDVFLNSARRDRLAVVISLLDGRVIEGRIKHFDRYALVMEIDGADQLVFKHAIVTVGTPRAIANYLSPSHA